MPHIRAFSECLTVYDAAVPPEIEFLLIVHFKPRWTKMLVPLIVIKTSPLLMDGMVSMPVLDTFRGLRRGRNVFGPGPQMLVVL